MRSFLMLLLFTFVSSLTFAGDILLEKPNTDDVLDVLGYSYWKFSVPNEKKLKTIQCEVLSYSKDKNGVWSKLVVNNSSFAPSKDAKAPDRFTVGFYQKGNEIILKLESKSFTFKAEGKHAIDKMENSANTLSLDDNGDIILKWKSATPTDAPKKDTMQSYLALHINIADSLK